MLADSTGRKLGALVLATGGIVWFFEATMRDSPSAPDHAMAASLGPSLGDPLTFTATAYCTGTRTSAGVAPARGVAAADPSVLPVGSIVDLDTGDATMNGLYTVLDTGPKVKGRRLDLYNKSCAEAIRFGRRTVRVSILRTGWNDARARTDSRRRDVPADRKAAGRPK